MDRSDIQRIRSGACWLIFLRDQREVHPEVSYPARLIEPYARLRGLVYDERLVIPGHDRAVMHAFLPDPSNLSGLSVRSS